jgi:K+-transporting ATPase A subunit
LKSLTAHPVLIVPGYLFAIAAAVGIYFYDVQKEVAAGGVVLALIIAAIIFFKKPLSVHHAAFITVAVLFVVVFGALHYFPQLRHGT